MSQKNYVILDQSGTSFLADLNGTLEAIATNNSGSVEPPVMYANMWWADTATDNLKRRNDTNTAWVTVMPLSLAITTYGSSLVRSIDAAAARTALSAASSANSIIAGNGLSGGGTLEASRTLTLGTPSTVTGTSTNASSSGTHSHAISLTPAAIGLGASNNAQFNSLGIGASATGTAGQIVATNSIISNYSDDRFKTNLGNISDALAKVLTLNGFYYEPNELAQSYGYEKKLEVGVSAQQVQAVQPEVVVPAPIDGKYLTVQYEKLVPLLIEAIKELNIKIDTLEQR